MTVTDRETGATYSWAARRHRVTMALADDATADERNRLWRDGRAILGFAKQQLGRPPGTAIITDDEQIYEAMRATKKAERRLTEKNVATNGGTFSPYNLRAYLRRSERTWADLLDTFRSLNPSATAEHRTHGAGRPRTDQQRDP
jgi:hypothetical protein